MIAAISANSIGPVIPTTIVGLVAVLFYYLYHTYKNKKDADLKSFESIKSDDKKIEFLERQLNEFGLKIDTSKLTPEQLHDLLIKQVKEKTRRLLIYSILTLLLAIIVAILLSMKTIKPEPLQLTVYVYDGDDSLHAVKQLEGVGTLIVDFRNDRRSPKIGERGRTNMGEIPADFANRRIPISLDAEDYEPAFPNKTYLMNGEPVYFKVNEKDTYRIIEGTVRDSLTKEFLPGAKIIVDGESTLSDSLGHFKLTMPKGKEQTLRYDMTVTKTGYQTQTVFYVPKSTKAEIRLEK
jgi:hypothetical protein